MELTPTFKQYTLECISVLQNGECENGIGSKKIYHDSATRQIRLTVQLDRERYWFLSIFFDTTSSKIKQYSLDYEAASDSHYVFTDESKARTLLFDGEYSELYLDELFSKYIEEHGGFALQKAIDPIIISQYHFD